MDEQPVPRILSRHEHPLSCKAIDPDALKILYRLQQHGFAAYLVGGCVRDLLLGKDPKDFDVATNAHPQQIRDLFRNSRLIGRRFRLAHIYFKGGKFIEVSTFRRRSEFEEEGEKDHPQAENTFGTPGEDAFRRDITLNGIFYNMADFSLVDYVGGLEDMRQGIIRCIGDPEEKFVSDPVRMMRVIRQAARTGFTIESQTYHSLLAHVAKLRLCSRARVRDEFLRELREGSARPSLRLMIESGMLFILFPPFLRPMKEEESKEHLLKLAAALDDLSSLGEGPAEELSLALFLLPLLGFYCPFGDFPAGRRGQAIFQQKVRGWVSEILEPLQFTRHSKEAVVHLLSCQRIFHEFLPPGRLPFRLLRQSFFPLARLLFAMDATARGEDPNRMNWPTEERTPWRKKRRRKHRRKKKGPSFPGSGPAESQEGHLEDMDHS